ncbi:hypothetical protein [Nonomuraea gerenzanensis]|uniref:Uncharacterized protein n=1 Tax=Nonomuraea gerenzanensis TaxID=93944 RepID=A0A1M4DVG4_9ACTN|nr:hypothetical protein [Nonomuraea gerenzanensis]UBU12904.1 hypothetical protein LCN96_53110 [Nonomuraea gerenzanensis]SBO90559.1 hypothetical protein BN4615_P73 [Nonomuraea gerenzanensis]
MDNEDHYEAVIGMMMDGVKELESHQGTFFLEKAAAWRQAADVIAEVREYYRSW